MLFPETIIQRYQIRIHKRNEFLNGVTVPALATSKKKKKKTTFLSKSQFLSWLKTPLPILHHPRIKASFLLSQGTLKSLSSPMLVLMALPTRMYI